MRQFIRFIGTKEKKIKSDTFYDELLIDICVSCGLGFMIEITKNRIQCIKCGFAVLNPDDDLEMH